MSRFWRKFCTRYLISFFGLLFAGLSFNQPAQGLPAFARKYGLRCSACHESWPMLNYFGQKFKDNGYQLMNDRDAPIWQNPGYWPVTFRITPMWHRVSTGKVLVDTYQGGAQTANGGVRRITTSGFDLSGLDFHTGGTLEKNFSFYVLPSSNNTGSFHFETVMTRLDNLFGSPWLNLKLGKFELDNLLSEKRILTLTGNGGVYQLYHFRPIGDGNVFGQMGDNQLGAELMGHSWNDRTRYSAALLSSVDGTPGLRYGNAYTGFFTFSQAFDAGKLGVDRIGAYAMVGEAPTFYQTSTTSGVSSPLSGTGSVNKSFHREGFVGIFYFGSHVDLQVVTQHGWDNAWFGQGYGDLIGGSAPKNNVPGTSLAVGSQAPTWNGILLEPHYVFSPQLIFIGRYETLRNSRQAQGAAYPTTVTGSSGISGPEPSNFGNLSDFTVGFRYNPFMTSRAGFAWHNEYNWLHQNGLGTVLGLGTPNVNTSELLTGFDFDF